MNFTYNHLHFRSEDTDNAAKCPGTEPHEPRGVIQAVRTFAPPIVSDSPESSPRAAHDLEAAVNESQKAVWQQKKQRKESELKNAEAREEYLRQFVTYCNRGGEVVTKNRESGLKSKVKCNDVRSEFESVQKKRTALQAYLNDGLRKECRKAGCLPGWLR